MEESRIVRPLGLGADGASYLVERADGSLAELRRLHVRAITVATARRLRVLSQLSHPCISPVHEIALEGEHPRVIVGAADWCAAWPRDPSGVRAWLRDLLEALAEAHRFDVVHGAIDAGCVGATSSGPWLDLTGLRVREPIAAPRAPELEETPPTAAADVWALATMAAEASIGVAIDDELRALLDELTAPDPEARPSARAAAARLGGEATRTGAGQTTEPGAGEAIPQRIGAYELVALLGEGGMGRVYRARDAGGGPDVALKVLLPQWAENTDVVKRFYREARVLAQLESPHVTRFVGVNEDSGLHYLVMEHFDAASASGLLRERKKLDVDLALAIACDTARALAEVHALGLVHRDVKPGNVLVAPGEPPRVKLCDFGIARSSASDRTELTEHGTPGTPAYMSPEQVRGDELDPRSDVYSLGATLYALLAGRPPFDGIPSAVMLAQVTDDPPPLREHEPSVPPEIEAVVMRCLAKDPADRYADGGQLGDALQTAWRGAADTADALPRTIGISGEPRVYDFRWELAAEPAELWPHVSNTERFNRAAGLDEVEWTHSEGEGYVRTEGQFRAAGMTLRWKENPFEWVAPRRLGVVREYVAGPFEWLRNIVELQPREGGGTTLRHRVEILPRGIVGRVAASLEVGLRLKRGFERVYRRIDQSCVATRGQRDSVFPDPFEAPLRASSDLEARVHAILSRVVARGADPLVCEALGELVCTAPLPTIARVRPRVFAAERGLPPERTLEACLIAASEGALELLWDILCPSCRVPSSIEESLGAVSAHGRCEVCDLDFELDLARSVEMIFRAHPSLRASEIGTYCIGGPAHFPHVVAQVRLAAGDRVALALELEEGSYRVAGRGVPSRWGFSVSSRANGAAWELSLRAGVSVDLARSLRAGTQRVTLVNDLGHEAIVRIERAAERTDAVTAADAAANELFRQLFPEQVLAPDQLVSVSHVALLFAQLTDALSRFAEDEAAVHAELVELAHAVSGAASAEGGALVRLQGDGVMAVFSDRVAAARSALRVAEARRSVGVALHAGPARMMNVGGRLDYFGRTLHEGETMGRSAAPGDVLASEAMMADPVVATILLSRTTPRAFAQLGGLLVTHLGSRDDLVPDIDPSTPADLDAALAILE